MLFAVVVVVAMIERLRTRAKAADSGMDFLVVVVTAAVL